MQKEHLSAVVTVWIAVIAMIDTSPIILNDAAAFRSQSSVCSLHTHNKSEKYCAYLFTYDGFY